MSPRKSLLLLAFLVAVLVSITAYLYVAWKPPNPLRFRVVSITPVAPGTPGAAPFEMEVDIVNLSSIPLTLHSAVYRWDSSGASIFPTALTIPPNGTLRLKRPITEWLKGALEKWGITLEYATTSTVKRRTMNTCIWLHRHLPAAFSDYLPHVTHDVHETDLTYARPSPAPAP